MRQKGRKKTNYDRFGREMNSTVLYFLYSFLEKQTRGRIIHPMQIQLYLGEEGSKQGVRGARTRIVPAAGDNYDP